MNADRDRSEHPDAPAEPPRVNRDATHQNPTATPTGATPRGHQNSPANPMHSCPSRLAYHPDPIRCTGKAGHGPMAPRPSGGMWQHGDARRGVFWNDDPMHVDDAAPGLVTGENQGGDGVAVATLPDEQGTSRSVAARVDHYAGALRRADDEALTRTNFGQLTATYDDAARAAMAVADAEIEAATESLRAENERMRRELSNVKGAIKHLSDMGRVDMDRAEAAEAALAEERAKVARVKAAHKREPAVGGEGWSCTAGCREWPCATIAALAAPEATEGDHGTKDGA